MIPSSVFDGDTLHTKHVPMMKQFNYLILILLYYYVLHRLIEELHFRIQTKIFTMSINGSEIACIWIDIYTIDADIDLGNLL